MYSCLILLLVQKKFGCFQIFFDCIQSCSIQNNISVIFYKFINKFVQKCQCYYTLSNQSIPLVTVTSVVSLLTEHLWLHSIFFEWCQIFFSTCSNMQICKVKLYFFDRGHKNLNGFKKYWTPSKQNWAWSIYIWTM